MERIPEKFFEQSLKQMRKKLYESTYTIKNQKCIKDCIDEFEKSIYTNPQYINTVLSLFPNEYGPYLKGLEREINKYLENNQIKLPNDESPDVDDAEH